MRLVKRKMGGRRRRPEYFMGRSWLAVLEDEVARQWPQANAIQSARPKFVND